MNFLIGKKDWSACGGPAIERNQRSDIHKDGPARKNNLEFEFLGPSVLSIIFPITQAPFCDFNKYQPIRKW